MNVNQYIPSSSITSTSQLGSTLGLTDNSKADQSTSGSLDFASVLSDKLNDVNNKQVNADNLTTQYIQGGDVGIDQVMLGTEEAKMSLQMAVQVRNKILDAYQELNKMQV